METRALSPGERQLGANLSVGHKTASSGNRLLGRLPERELARLLPLFQRVEIAPRQILHHRSLPAEYVYFIERGLISVMAKISDRDWVEAWLIGAEGTTGVPVMLGDDHPLHRRIVQVGGTALRISSSAFCHLLEQCEPLRQILLRYVHLVLLQSAQSGACNAQHSAKQRLARWLLVARDGLDSGRIAVPQQALAQLIGVRRATIADCLNDLEARRAIRTARRLIEITDAELLESLSCDCHRIIKRERQRLLGM